MPNNGPNRWVTEYEDDSSTDDYRLSDRLNIVCGVLPIGNRTYEMALGDILDPFNRRLRTIPCSGSARHSCNQVQRAAGLCNRHSDFHRGHLRVRHGRSRRHLCDGQTSRAAEGTKQEGIASRPTRQPITALELRVRQQE